METVTRDLTNVIFNIVAKRRTNERTKWDLSIPDFEMPKKKRRRRRRRRRRREKTVTLIFSIFGKEEYAKNMLAREKKI